VSLNDLIGAMQVKKNKIAGIDAPMSGVYRNGYQVVHLGYGVDPNVQIPTILDKAGIHVALFGKAADVIQTSSPNVFYGVDTDMLFDKLLREMQSIPRGFFCLNIQETDLVGHIGDIDRYADRLELCDRRIAEFLPYLADGDILIITADHGNDPTIGHSNHTREKVPVLVYSSGVWGKRIGERNSLADIGASAADYFKVCPTQHGISFLKALT